MQDIAFATAFELANAIRVRQVSAVEVLEAHLTRIGRYNPALNAIVTLDEEGARSRAKAADAAMAMGEIWGPLHGVPITLKDVHDTAGIRSTMGLPALADRIPAVDNVVAARLKAAGAVLVGKTNAEIFPDNPFGQTHNPWDITRTPGGSSSGAAAALASGMTALDVGSDIGGSVIGPAHFSGIYGMRPTERRIPLGQFPTDPLPIWRIMAVFGPMARSVEDLRLALKVLLGPDHHDSEVPPLPWREPPPLALSELRIAWMPTFPGAPIAADICGAIEGLARELSQRGLRAQQCSPDIDLREQSLLWGQVWNAILGAIRAPHTSLSDYFAALHRRDGFIARWEAFFDEWDCLVCPVDKITAQPLNATTTLVDGVETPPGLGVEWSNLSPATGHPAIVIPVTLDRAGLPIGVQIIGRRWADERLLAIADVISSVTGGYRRPPGY
jgi:amidase